MSLCLCGDSLFAQTFTEQGASVLGGLNASSRSASFADIDNDGDPDLYIQTNATARKMLRNNVVGLGTATFTDVSSMMHPIGLNMSSWSAAWADVDSDGDVDVFVGCSNTSSERGDYLRNDGPVAGFTDAGVAVGLNDPGFHQNLAWCDIDRDLDLDLIMAMEGPEEHELYVQSPAGLFSPVGAAVGLQVPFGIKAYGMAVGDTDDDGDNDLYISTCRAGGNIRNNFFENRLVETGLLSFVDVADANGTQFMDNSYHAEFQDFDDDGDLDLFMVGADGRPSKIWRNDGGNQFTDVDTVTGHALISNTGGDLNGGKAVDYDNDGDLDLYFHDHLAISGGSNVARLLYRNDGGWQFTQVTTTEGLSSGNEDGYDSAWADFDLDGDQDLMCPNTSPWPERFYVSNASTNGNHWLYVRPRGAPKNTRAIGARLYATIHAGTQQQRVLRRDANPNAGTFNQSDVPVHFGLGSATVVGELRVVWPNGLSQTLNTVPVDQYLTVTYAPFGDCDLDGDIDLADHGCFAGCMTGPGGGLLPGCGSVDADADTDVDLKDASAFQAEY